MDIYEQLKRAGGQLKYVRDMLDSCIMESWEAKEYIVLEVGYLQRITELKSAIEVYEQGLELITRQ